MFQLLKHEASIADVNQRIERHGDERELAADVKFKTSIANADLEYIEKGLREALFRKPGKGEQQDLPITENPLSAVKFPSLEPLKLSHEFTGYEVVIDGLLEGIEPIVLADVKVKKFVLDPKEGGSVAVTFTASANVSSDELAELSEALIREDVLPTLQPPKSATHAMAA